MAHDLPFSLSLDLAPTGGAYPSLLAEARAALDDLVTSRSLDLLTNVERRDDIAAAARVARALSAKATDVVVLGIGGSSLGGQSLLDIAPRGQKLRVRFCDNPDPATFAQLLWDVPLKTTRFVAISKSGGTAETMIQVLAAVDALAKAGRKSMKDHFAVVTEPRPSPLRNFAVDIGCAILDHPLGIGGRYSVLTTVGMLPAILMGLKPASLRAGAQAVIGAAASPDAAPAVGAALHMTLAREGALRESVLWPYADKLKTFGGWWRQLWGESLGKNGQGSTPVAVLGPVDQHSQLQLFLDGPGGALFTLVSTEGKGPKISRGQAKKYGVDYLGGRSMGELVDAEYRATAETLARRGRPVRRIHVPKIDDRAYGALFMSFMLETILTGKLMGVDPFDQPAVEEGKVLTRRYLAGSA